MTTGRLACSDQCHDSFLCDWLSSSKRLSWEPRLGQSLLMLVVTSHHQRGRVIKPTKVNPGGWGGLFQLVTCADGSAENMVHSPLVLLHTHHWAEGLLGAPTLPPPTTGPEANFLLCLELNGWKKTVTFFFSLHIRKVIYKCHWEEAQSS